jgi:hypothetical protein
MRRRIVIRQSTRDFSRGDPVERKDNPRHVGVVQQINHKASGTTVVRVKWQNGWIEVLPQEELTVHRVVRGPSEVEQMQQRLRT